MRTSEVLQRDAYEDMRDRLTEAQEVIEQAEREYADLERLVDELEEALRAALGELRPGTAARLRERHPVCGRLE